jgi:hypothetical protein
MNYGRNGEFVHPYSTPTRRWKIIGVLMAIALGITSTINQFLIALNFDIVGISAFAVFTGLYLAFDYIGWRLPGMQRVLATPDLNGTWEGDFSSSFDDGDRDSQTNEDEREPRLEIQQRWSMIEVIFVNPGSSRSESTSATIRTDKSDPELLFTYRNRKIGDELPENQRIHEGTNRLRLVTGEGGGLVLEGDYYTDEQRNNHGYMRFERKSKSRILGY